MLITAIQDHFAESLPCLEGWKDRNLVPLYHRGYYDGPLSGVCKIGPDYYYTLTPWDLSRDIWVCWKLTQEEIELELISHRAFQDHVGIHTDYFETENGWDRHLGSLKPEEELKKYFDQPPKGPDFDAIKARPIDGWIFNPFR